MQHDAIFVLFQYQVDLEDGKFLMAKDLTIEGAYIAANFSSSGAVVVGSL